MIKILIGKRGDEIIIGFCEERQIATYKLRICFSHIAVDSKQQ